MQVTLEEAQATLPELVKAAARGEEIVVTENDFAVARIISEPTIPNEGLTRPQPRFGSARGLISMSDDFDAPLEDFKDYM